MKKEKRTLNLPFIILSSLMAIVLILIISFFYLSIKGSNYDNIYLKKLEDRSIINPVKEFNIFSSQSSEEEIKEDATIIKINTEDGEKQIIINSELPEGISKSDIQKELINYASVVLKLYNLQEIPFTKNTPKIQIKIDNDYYFIEVSKGDVFINEGITKKEDILIETTYEEILKMIENKDYARESVYSGKTTIKISASEFVLFAKGYLKLYEEMSKL